MKNILLIGAKESGLKNNISIIEKYLTKHETSLRVTKVFWEDLIFDIKTNDVEVFVNDKAISEISPQLVIATGWYKNGNQRIYRDVAYALALFLNSRSIDYWNSEMGAQRSTSKLSCMVQLALEGISVPATNYSLTESSVIQVATLPFIAKSPTASRGRDNYLVQDEADRQQIKKSDDGYIIQQFLPNDHDLRVICFGGIPTLILKRSRKLSAETHLNNTSQGGDSIWLEPSTVSKELLTISRKICNIMKRELAGIDFIPDQSSPFGYSCLEVNAIPQLTSGVDVEKKMNALKYQLEKES